MINAVPPESRATFSIDPALSDDQYLFVHVGQTARVVIKRETEGIVVDVYHATGGEPVASTYAFDNDLTDS
jgi:hypothetical protein